MIKIIFRPITIITVVGFIITLISSPKPGVHITHLGPHTTQIVHNSTSVFVVTLISGILIYFVLGIIGEIIFWIIKWIIKRKPINN